MTERFGTIASIIRIAMLSACSCWWASCSGIWGDDEFEQYVQRTDKITESAGDAKEVNAITQMYSPWPPGVGDRRIIADSAHMQRALERYRRGARPPEPLPDIGIEDTALGTTLAPERAGQGAATDAGGGGPVAAPKPYLGQ